MPDTTEWRTRTRLLVVVALLAVVAGAVAQLPASLTLTQYDPDASLINAAAWTSLCVLWIALVARDTRPIEQSWHLPTALFQSGVAVGGTAILAARVASLAIRGVAPATLVSGFESLLYELGVLALASLAAFAVSRSLLRPALAGSRPPVGVRDIALRTRIFVATMGASFATAGILLNVLLDFDATPPERLASYLATAAGLVVASAFIGWLVGEDTSRGIDDVTRRVRDLARAEGPTAGEVPPLAADEIGDLILATNELERRIRREEAERAATAERERIARELHDGVAKSVSVLSLDLATVARRAPEALRPSLGRIEHLAHLLSDELRAIVLAFRTRSEEVPFAAAVDRTARANGAMSVEIAGDLERLGGLARFEVLRVVEEAVRNANEHARASRIETRLRVDDRALHLVVEDDGAGVGPISWQDLERSGHFGLLGMRERAALLDGELRIERPSSGGTRVSLDVPLDGVPA